MAEEIKKAVSPLPVSAPGWEEVAKVARGIYGKGLTEAEFNAYLMVARKLGLDPVSKEIIPQVRVGRDGSRQLTLIVTRDGYLKAAMRDPGFRGIQSMVVKEGDHFEVVPSEGKVIHKFGAKRGKILGAWAIAYHAHRQPVVFWADYAEYAQANAKSPVWRTYPSAMIQKTAEIGALRRQFNLSGVVGAEEIPEGSVLIADEDAVTVSATPVEEQVTAEPPAGPGSAKEPVAKPDSITHTKEFRHFRALLNDLGVKDRELAIRLVSAIVGRELESSKELTMDELLGVISVLTEAKRDAEPIPPEERPEWVASILIPQLEEANGGEAEAKAEAVPQG